MNRKLYLHIGNHKTASTSIQVSMFGHKDPRIFADWAPNPEGRHLSGWPGNSWTIRNKSNVFTSADIHPELAQSLIEHNPEGDVLHTSEDMSWVFDAAQIDAFARALRAHFYEIEVIVYLRRQDRNLLSFYNEGMRPHHTRFAQFTGIESLSLPDWQPHFDLYFDYHQRLGKWADAFGDQAMRIFVFEDLLPSPGILKHFFNLVHLKIKKTDKQSRASKSKSMLLMSLISRNLGLNLRLVEELSEWDWKTSPPRPKRAQAEALYAHFAKSNQALQQRFQINDRKEVFDLDFSAYPEDGDEEWDNASAKEAVDFLLFTLDKELKKQAELKKALEAFSQSSSNE